MFEIFYMELLFNLFISGILCCIIHEGSHMLVAKLFFNKSINFHFEYGNLFNFIYIPRGIWNMPNGLSKKQQKLIAGAGFTGEFIFGIILFMIYRSFSYYYLLVALLHILLYNFYAGENSDFKFFKD